MNNRIEIKDIDNKNFWISFFSVSYPNSYDEKTNETAADILRKIRNESVSEWWDEFTGYNKGILLRSGGYLEDAATFETYLNEDEFLSIEFHPGNILYFINGREIGRTGRHWELQVFPYKKVKKVLDQENGDGVFFLLLPLAVLKKEEVEEAECKIRELLPRYVPEELCDRLAKCIVNGLY